MIDNTILLAGGMLAFTILSTFIGLYLSWKQVKLQRANNVEYNTKMIGLLQSIDDSLRKML